MDKSEHWKTLEGKTILPEHQALELFTQMHRYTHLCSEKLEQAIKGMGVVILNLGKLADMIARNCEACQR